jgi:hypothetical protein
MHPPVPRSGHHAALLLLAGSTGSTGSKPAASSPLQGAGPWRRQAFFALSNSTQVLLEPQRSVLPGAPITAPAGAPNGRF